MSTQLDLFASAPSAPRSINADAPYRPFDAAEAQRIILTACRKAGQQWTTRMRLHRSTGMRQAKAGELLDQLVGAGILEATTVYYGSDTPGSKDYRGYTTGYRLAAAMKEAA